MFAGRTSSEGSRIKALKVKISPGSIVRINCDFIENPKIKYIVIAHIDFENNSSLVFIINSKIPQFIERDSHLKAGQIALNKSEYPFFPNECSFLNCIEVYEGLDLDFMINHLLDNPGEYKGKLLNVDIQKLISFAKIAQTIPQADKQKIVNSFGQ